LTPDTLHGLLVLDKPAGLTSRAAVDGALRWFPRRTRLGHTGTLDPLATGVLVLCVGAATRLTEYIQRMAKTYRAGVVFGARSDTDDADGQVTATPGAVAPARTQVEEALRTFLGEIEQVPPAYSAAHVTGRRAYDLARRGEEVNLTPRKVTVYAIDVDHYEYPRLGLTVRCGKGTYIRALARDLGERLGCGGYIASLRRTRVGPFDESQAAPLDGERPPLLPLALAVADLPRLDVAAEEAARLRHGRPLPRDGFADGQEVAVFDGGELIAVARADPRERCLRPEKVFGG